MELKEKWICPNAEVQLFTPQEYIAACYRITVTCKSLGYVSSDGTKENITQHEDGHTTVFILSSNGTPIPSQVKDVMQSTYHLTTKNSAKSYHEKNWGQFQNHAVSGYTWDGGHFIQDVNGTNWYTPVPSPENAS